MKRSFTSHPSHASNAIFALTVSFAVALFGCGPANAKPVGTNGQIAYTALDAATGDPLTVIVNADGTGTQRLALPVPNGNPRWSPDGSRLVVFTFSEAGLRPAVVNADGSGFTILTVPGLPALLDISPCVWIPPAGRRLACSVRNFASADHSLDGIYSIAADGSNPVRLTTNPYPPSGEFGGGDTPGDYSPDGRQFVFMRARQDQSQARGRQQSGALFIENADGSGLRQLTQYGLANSHDGGVEGWSPDGTRIVFGGEQGGLFTIDPNGTALASVPIRGAGSATFAFGPAWSPDGTRIVTNLYLATTGRVDVYTVQADGRGLTALTTDGLVGGLADWAPSTA